MLVPNLSNAASLAITATSAQFAIDIVPGRLYRLCADVDFWFRLDMLTATAVAGTKPAIFVPAGAYEYIQPTEAGYKLAAIRSAVSGTVNLVEMIEVVE
jgi:hypothetical protein